MKKFTSNETHAINSGTHLSDQTSHIKALDTAQRNTKEISTKKVVFFSVTGVLALLLFIGLGLGGALYVIREFTPNAFPSLITNNDGNATVTQTENSIAAVAEKVGPSVVSIVTQANVASFYGTTSSEAAGTGIIVSRDGYIMTNNHVIENAATVAVIDNTGKQYKNVKILGRDPLNDIAFLKVTADTEFTPAELGNSATLRIGQQVVAIGNALGRYSNTVTSGIVSGIGRSITASSQSGSRSESLSDLIQTDASINPGNSGGPLVNMAGQIIGINTAIAQDSNGIGFAIPINSTKGVLAGVLETGKVSRAYLGISYLTVTPDVAREYDLSAESGAYVFTASTSNAVAAGSPADKAGLKEGDVITKINHQVVGQNGSLSSILGEYRPNDKITITYIRNGEEYTTSATLAVYDKN